MLPQAVLTSILLAILANGAALPVPNDDEEKQSIQLSTTGISVPIASTSTFSSSESELPTSFSVSGPSLSTLATSITKTNGGTSTPTDHPTLAPTGEPYDTDTDSDDNNDVDSDDDGDDTDSDSDSDDNDDDHGASSYSGTTTMATKSTGLSKPFLTALANLGNGTDTDDSQSDKGGETHIDSYVETDVETDIETDTDTDESENLKKADKRRRVIRKRKARY